MRRRKLVQYRRSSQWRSSCKFSNFQIIWPGAIIFTEQTNVRYRRFLEMHVFNNLIMSTKGVICVVSDHDWIELVTMRRNTKVYSSMLGTNWTFITDGTTTIILSWHQLIAWFWHLQCFRWSGLFKVERSTKHVFLIVFSLLWRTVLAM